MLPVVVERVTFIYALTDPLTKQVRYIGKSNDPKRRLAHHVNYDGPNTHFNRWIKRLAQYGFKPILEILDEVPIDGWEQHERRWIAYGRESGLPLINIADGGQQPPLNDEIRAKLSAIRRSRPGPNLGKRLTEEWKRRVALAGIGRRHTQESKAKISAALLGRRPSEASILKNVEKHRGKRASEESRAKMSLARKGLPSHWRGKRQTIEHRTKNALSKMGELNARWGVKLSDETKRKISEAQKKRLAKCLC